MILVCCEHITPRISYVFDFVFGDILGTEYRVTGDLNEFNDWKGPKLAYSDEKIPGELVIRPHGILAETGVSEQEIKVFKWNDLPVFFKAEEDSAMPFDPFAVAFYLITRYEEYLPFKPDEHGRFRVELSLAYRAGFLHIPLADAVIYELMKVIETRFPDVEIKPKPFRFVPTFDIDIAFAHLGKGFNRATAAWLKLIITGQFSQISERISTLSGKIPDPYDNFNLHVELAGKFDHPVKYFVLAGNFGKYDRNTSYKSRRFRDLLKKLSLTADLGIHPSYRSYLLPGLFEEEKNRLEDITGKNVTDSRFHFLRLKFPESYRILIDKGITDDYSLGYSSVNGFRAGTCHPFYYYDLIKEERTTLRLHPFIFMDSAMIDHLEMNPDEAIKEIENLTDQVKKYGGEAIGIWHNYSLSEKGQYKGWQLVLKTILEKYKNSGK